MDFFGFCWALSWLVMLSDCWSMFPILFWEWPRWVVNVAILYHAVFIIRVVFQIIRFVLFDRLPGDGE